MNEVDEMKKGRTSYTIGWMLFSEESELIKSDPKNIFGFVEGVGDLSFYNHHVKTAVNSKGGDLILYYSHGIDGVKYAYDKTVNCAENLKNRIIFFRDRDLSAVVTDEKMISGTNVYITDEYSIENSFLNENTFRRVMVECLGYKDQTRECINEKINNYKLSIGCFKELFLDVMALIIYWRKSSQKPNLKNVKVVDLIEIPSPTSVVFRSDFCDKFSTSCGLKNCATDISKDEVKNIKKEINGKIELVRGHFIEQFFIKYTNDFVTKGMRLNGESSVNDIVIPRSDMPKTLRKFVDDVINKYYDHV